MKDNEENVCTVCADEACSCHEICGTCNNWDSICSCAEDARDMDQEMRREMDDE